MKNRIIAILSVIIGLLPMVARAQNESKLYEVSEYTYCETIKDGKHIVENTYEDYVYYFIVDTIKHRVNQITQSGDASYAMETTIPLYYDDDKATYYNQSCNILFTKDLEWLNVVDADGDILVCSKSDEFLLSGEDLLIYVPESDEYVTPDKAPVRDPGNWDYVLFILLAILPGAVLFIFIRWRDRLRPEPVKEILIAFLLGALIILPAIFLEKWIHQIQPLYPDTCPLWLKCTWTGFIAAGFPEELVKILALLLFFRWRRHQNEYMDGIVYAACIGLGFALAENIKYIVMILDNEGLGLTLTSTVVSRALLSVPCHFACGVLMGYFFSYFLFIPVRRWLSLTLALVVPFLFHGLYDALSFIYDYHPILQKYWTFVFLFAFFAIFFYVNQLCVKAIRSALKTDSGIK